MDYTVKLHENETMNFKWDEARPLVKRTFEETYVLPRSCVLEEIEEIFSLQLTEVEEKYPLCEIHLITKEEFDHGGTRHLGTTFSGADYLLFLTQDAEPANDKLVENLVQAFLQDDSIKAAYGRQLPNATCREIEKYTRSFNYPAESRVKSRDDLKTLGIKTFFCSNVCAMYEKAAYDRLGGFIRRTIFNEDMIYAGGLIKNDYKIHTLMHRHIRLNRLQLRNQKTQM